jgi:hypothetical protein
MIYDLPEEGIIEKVREANYQELFCPFLLFKNTVHSTSEQPLSDYRIQLILQQDPPDPITGAVGSHCRSHQITSQEQL